MVTETGLVGNVTAVTHNYTVADLTGPAVTLTTPAEGATFDREAVRVGPRSFWNQLYYLKQAPSTEKWAA